MLTHEELMEICQEVQDAVDALADAMYENGGIFNSDLDDHEYYMIPWFTPTNPCYLYILRIVL